MEPRHRFVGSDPQAVRHFFGMAERGLRRRRHRNVETGVEAHRINIRRDPVIEVNRPRQITAKIFRGQKITELDFLADDGAPLRVKFVLYSLVSQADNIAGSVDAKQDTDFFEELAEDRDPMAQRGVGIMTAAKNSLRLCAGAPILPAQHCGRIIALMYCPARKDIEAAEKAHPLGTACQKYFKTAGAGRPNQRHS
jgi:hypothetical protein